MELSSLSENIVIVPYERAGETVELSVNIDAFTPEFYRRIAEVFKDRMAAAIAEDKQKAAAEKAKRLRGTSAKKKSLKKKGEPNADVEFFETEARALEIQREINVDLLTNGVLVGWTVEVDGIPIAPSAEVLRRQPPRFVQELWDTCRSAAQTVKKRAESETKETSEITHDGLRALKVVGQST